MATFIAGEYDVVVIGAGHAGCEAALAAARLGKKTAIFSINLDSIGNMPCNPSIGGTAKGHLVREIDALGGEMGKAADKTFIQSKMLNSAKGPAVYSLRAQIDRRAYQSYMKYTLESQENLDVKQGEIVEILTEEVSNVENVEDININKRKDEEKDKKVEEGSTTVGRIKRIAGVKTCTGTVYICKSVIITTGTYLKAKIIIGDYSFNGGPDGLLPSNLLSDSLKSLEIELMRFKTGTPARINRRSIDFSKIEVQHGADRVTPFSFENENNIDIINKKQIPCWLTYTNNQTHEVIKGNIHRSPLYGGEIKGIGPRYCPSIEDKVVRFADKDRHQAFIEPMGLDTQEMYLQGMSSSLPEDVQIAMMKTLPGLENVSVMRSAYAIEYDCINPQQLKLSLEFKNITGLFSAGQINGSSGYEEAAAQGLIAGINASRKIDFLEALILDRSQAYIGVLIDDLVTKGTNEPYRMMTSRSEYRLHLRQDNADERLTPIGRSVGLISDERYNYFEEKWRAINKEIERIENINISPKQEVLELLDSKESTRIKSGIKLKELIKRPEISYDDTSVIDQERPALSYFVKEQVNIQIKYEGYIKRQLQQIEQFKKLEARRLPKDMDYSQISGLRLEARQKLNQVKPASLGQASRISGVSPADISVLLVYLEARR